MSLRRFTRSIYTDIYLNAADRLGLRYQVLSRRFPLCRIEHGEKALYLRNAHMSCNDITAVHAAGNKPISLGLFQKAGLPIPEFRLFRSAKGFRDETLIAAILEFARARYPVVVKPISGLGGGGVVADIRDEQELRFVLKDERLRRRRQLLVEQHIRGAHFRVMVINGKAIDVVERVPANVVGDGRHSIRQLIETKNKQRRRFALPRIKVDDKLDPLLKKDGHTLDYSPFRGEKIVLSDLCNLKAGGDVIDVAMEQIPNTNLELFGRAARVARLGFAGVDFITPDIMRPYDKVSCAINEINSQPAPDVPSPDFETEQVLRMPTRLLQEYFNLTVDQP